MTKRILFFIITAVFLFSFAEILSAGGEEDIAISKIRYKLDGVSVGEVDITPVTVTLHNDGSAYAPVSIYAFPEPLEGTITEFDFYLTLEGESFWFCEGTEGAQLSNQYFSGDGDPSTGSGIAVTGSTEEIYIGVRYIEGEALPPQIVSPGTE